jgi:glycosyltransferase involved in cell wall biosynthesis
MKIVYLYTQLTISGGADRVLTDKANYLAEHGYNITIITESQMGRPIVFPLSPKVKMVDMGIDFNKQYEYNFLLRSVIYLKCIQQYKIRLKELLKKLKPDIVITLMGRSLDFITSINDDSIKIGEAHTTKAHLRSYHLLEARGGLYKILAKQLRKKQIANASKLSALVLLTPQDADDWKGVTKTYVIANAMHYMPHENSTLTNKQAIMVGRYNDAKGYEFIVEAWSIVHQKHPDWKLNIYGSGELHDDVERWIKERELEETMIMHEPTNQITQKYLESSICVMSSRYEGFPLVIMEAMACGVPCVSFDSPFGPRNIIKDGEDGILVDYLNSQALAENICKVIEDEQLRKRLGEKAKQNIQRFSQDAIMKQWTDLFDSLLNTQKQ